MRFGVEAGTDWEAEATEAGDQTYVSLTEGVHPHETEWSRLGVVGAIGYQDSLGRRYRLVYGTSEAEIWDPAGGEPMPAWAEPWPE